MLYASYSFSQDIIESAYYTHNSELGEDAIIAHRITAINNDEATTSFEFYVQTTAYYYIQFWMCPTQLKDGSFATYKVQKNNETSTFYIWQAISLYNETYNHMKGVTLNKGTHTITIPIKRGNTYLVSLIIDGHVNIKKIMTN